ncbi:hypothetical protein FH610_040135 [Microbispora catharanthi]|uniref:Uncharacterized protein n=1 Tax=Microbispora catharanthi TaxID=1712871 RepID=A0A5N6B386_9ACTN|nr:hypothetical protein FH610_040135 [Microbispora catharanthi]
MAPGSPLSPLGPCGPVAPWGPVAPCGPSGPSGPATFQVTVRSPGRHTDAGAVAVGVGVGAAIPANPAWPGSSVAAIRITPSVPTQATIDEVVAAVVATAIPPPPTSSPATAPAASQVPRPVPRFICLPFVMIFTREGRRADRGSASPERPMRRPPCGLGQRPSRTPTLPRGPARGGDTPGTPVPGTVPSPHGDAADAPGHDLGRPCAERPERPYDARVTRPSRRGRASRRRPPRPPSRPSR